jgi:hypothetical protein
MKNRTVVPLLALLLLPGWLWAAPEADLWERWQTPDRDSQLNVDHRNMGSGLEF